MKFIVRDSFKVKTNQGEVILQAGQTITLPKESALKLLSKGKIVPAQRYAVRVYSEVLGCHLWVVHDEADRKTLRARGIDEAVYSGDEIRALKGKSTDHLRAVNEAKTIFPGSTIEANNLNEKEKRS